MGERGHPPARPFECLRVSGPPPESAHEGRPLRGSAAYFLRGVPPLLTFAHVSLSETVRLNTGDPVSESGSTAK